MSVSTSVSKMSKIKMPETEKTLDTLKPVPFSEQFRLPGTGMLFSIEGKSITDWANSVLPCFSEMKENQPLEIGGGVTLVKQKWVLNEVLDVYNDEHTIHSFVTTNPYAYLPILFNKEGRIWMSLTPGEICSQRKGLSYGKGDVLIGGMGLGWLALRVLERKCVKSVTVVDIDPNILNFFGNFLKKRFPEKVNLVLEDFYDYANRDGYKYDSVLADIWEKHGTSHSDKRWQKLKKRLKKANPSIRIWAWGDCKFIGFKDKAFQKMSADELVFLLDLITRPKK